MTDNLAARLLTSLDGEPGPFLSTPVLVICRGLPASGKTTFARAWVADDPSSRARVNKDDLRRLMHDGVYRGKETERQINAARDAMIEQLLRAGISVVSDDTNLPQPVARDLARVGRRARPNVTIAIKDFTDVPVDLCIERDFGRREGIVDKSVGPDVIRGMAERYLTKNKYPLPFPLDAADMHTFAPYHPNLYLRPAWLVDLDGTLARMDGRGPFEWHRVGEDTVVAPVARIVESIVQHGRDDVVIVSGRDSVCRPETEAWLRKHEISYDALYMRPEGDNRKDSIVKRELLDVIALTYHVVGSLDDRDQVVEMWRAVGIPCFQVAPGAF